MARKGENIYKRKDGRWEARYIKARNIDGKAIYGYLYRHSYREAKRAQAEERVKCINDHTNKRQLSTTQNLDDYLSMWLQSIRTSVKKSTFSNYSGLIRRHISPVLGKTPLYQISSELVQDYINRKLENGRLDGMGGISVKTARDIIGLLKHSLKSGGIELQINLPHYSLPKLRTLTSDERLTLIATAKSEDSLEGLGILLCLFTGIRIGELCSLKWRDVSLEEGILKINKTIRRIETCGNQISKTVISIDTPKSDCSVRNIPLPKFLLSQLKHMKESANENDYILSGGSHYVEPRCCQYRFKKLIKAARIEDINFHALRHTFATRCVELGIDIKTLSEILGHSNVNITLNRYVHPSFEYQRKCMEKVSVSF
ncbi:MAG: site-specific integrase [Oscillibacter sp.]|nr:site-specific integrase [Oscillibacter sp.]